MPGVHPAPARGVRLRALVIAAGSRLGPYEVLSALGAGGMGEVYKARDSRLGREVAVKVLPEDFLDGEERRQRFEREARLLAALNHPNIAVLYSFEEIPVSPSFSSSSSSSRHILVMELLEGETLRQTIAVGKLPLRKAVDWAIQIARGLSAAHEKSVIHRDLKPENLFVTKDGRVKILDFGLAKLAEDAVAGQGSNLPTAARGTEPGVVLGTMGYMAPEQLRGKLADARSDLFAFGAVLYEMLSGKKAFSGDSGADVITAILREEPADLSITNQSVPPGLERIVRRCLEKAPEQRFQSAGDLAFALESLSTDSAARLAATDVEPSRVMRRRAPLLAAAGALVVAGFFAGRAGQRPAPAPTLLFERLSSDPGVERSPALSPDGETVAYVKAVAGHRHVFVQRVGSDKPIDLSADSPDDDRSDPTFSPDGSLVAFCSGRRAGGGIFVMGPLGESVRRVTDEGYGPAFAPDGREIVYAEEAALSPLARGTRSHLWAVELATGKKRMLFGPDAIEPAVSPHGKRVAFWGLIGDTAQRDIWTVPLAGLKEGEHPVPVTNDAAVDFSPFWSGDGSFLYFGSDRGGSLNLWRILIDEASGIPRGSPEPITVPVTWAGTFPGSFRGSLNGKRIAFTAPAELMTIEKLALEPGTLNPVGPPVVLRRSSTAFEDLEISPDGATLATRTAGRIEDICLVSADGQKLRRLTHDELRNRAPVFTADGKRLVFYSNREGDYGAYSISADGSGLSRLTPAKSPFYLYPALSPDGRFIAAASFDTRVAVFPLVAGSGGALSVGVQASELPSRWPWGWSREGTRLLAAGPGGELALEALLCTPEKKDCEDLGVRAYNAKFAPDGRKVVLSTPDGIRVLDLATRQSRLIHPAAEGTLQRIALSPDGRALYFLRNVTESDIWVGTFR
jgi:eukaryotic-like serine/threonine-protein kinase